MSRIVDIITMGCSKNLVDSEQLLHLFQSHGYTIYHNPEQVHGGIAVVNTCGFIGDAKEESINMILELCALKEDGLLEKLYVMGCLSERYLAELEKEIPQVDKYYGKFNWVQLVNDLDTSISQEADNSCDAQPTNRVLTTPTHYAYIKISEGCNRHCAYCAIPIITGRHTSRTIEDILAEVEMLTKKGVKEFQVIAQELTSYGLDLYGRPAIAELVEKMAALPGVEWIRLHYAYPTGFPMDLLRVMREQPKVCKYLDIALQHINDEVLQRMRRHTTRQETLDLIQAMRREVPGICLRTTLMVGFPGETQAQFEELVEFVREVKFERMGAFAYCEEEGTYAAKHYTDDIPQEVKDSRLDILMEAQEEIANQWAENQIGKTYRVIIDRLEGEYYVGRTEYDSPEVDCEVLIHRNSADLQLGQFYNARITDAEVFDFFAEVVNEEV